LANDEKDSPSDVSYDSNHKAGEKIAGGGGAKEKMKTVRTREASREKTSGRGVADADRKILTVSGASGPATGLRTLREEELSRSSLAVKRVKNKDHAMRD